MFLLLDSEKKSPLLSEEQQATSTLVETIRQSIQRNDVLKPISLLSQQIKPDKTRQRYNSAFATQNNVMFLKIILK